MKHVMLEVDEIEEEVERKKAAYLKSQGWDYTRGPLIAQWLWKKEIAGVTYMVDQQTAIDLAIFHDETYREEGTGEQCF